jgi:hypothetical protein
MDMTLRSINKLFVASFNPYGANTTVSKVFRFSGDFSGDIEGVAIPFPLPSTILLLFAGALSLIALRGGARARGFRGV